MLQCNITDLSAPSDWFTYYPLHKPFSINCVPLRSLFLCPSWRTCPLFWLFPSPSFAPSASLQLLCCSYITTQALHLTCSWCSVCVCVYMSVCLWMPPIYLAYGCVCPYVKHGGLVFCYGSVLKEMHIRCEHTDEDAHTLSHMLACTHRSKRTLRIVLSLRLLCL